jgi:hypothetical protein
VSGQPFTFERPQNAYVLVELFGDDPVPTGSFISSTASRISKTNLMCPVSTRGFPETEERTLRAHEICELDPDVREREKAHLIEKPSVSLRLFRPRYEIPQKSVVLSKLMSWHVEYAMTLNTLH